VDLARELVGIWAGPLVTIQCRDRLDVLAAELEIEDIEVPVGVVLQLRRHEDLAPAQARLTDGLPDLCLVAYISAVSICR